MVVKRLPFVFQMPNAGPPGQTFSLYKCVPMRWPAAVKALSIAIDMEVSLAPSIREKWSRWVEESQTAMFMASPIDRALASHASTAALAASSVSVSVLMVGAIVTDRGGRVEMEESGKAQGGWVGRVRSTENLGAISSLSWPYMTCRPNARCCGLRKADGKIGKTFTRRHRCCWCLVKDIRPQFQQ
jgi:hypothetical protein